jgi:hypothetical protein
MEDSVGGIFSVGNDLFLSHSGDDADNNVLSGFKGRSNLGAKLRKIKIIDKILFNNITYLINFKPL